MVTVPGTGHMGTTYAAALLYQNQAHPFDVLGLVYTYSDVGCNGRAFK